MQIDGTNNSIRFENGRAYINNISIRANLLPYYRKNYAELSDIKKERLYAYILSPISKYGISDIIIDNGNIKFKYDEIFEKIEIRNDPTVGKNFHIKIFDSVTSIQWHILCHGIMDYWLNGDSSCLLLNYIEGIDKLNELYTNFINKKYCNIWNHKINGQNAAAELNRFEYTRRGFGSKHGCFNCLVENDIEKFINCSQFLNEYRYPFIKICHDWITKTISNISRRMHFHVRDNIKYEMPSYGIENIGGKYYVYEIKINEINPTEYKVVTFYRKEGHNQPYLAQNYIGNVANREYISCRKIANRCTEQNWAWLKPQKSSGYLRFKR